MKKFEYIYTDGDHKWAVIARDPEKKSYIIDTNEYLIFKSDEIILTDPGGTEIFPTVFTSISMEANPANIKYLFASHQDPDIISSLSLWLEVNPKLKCYISNLWSTFLPHFGGNDQTLLPITDDGMDLNFNGLDLKVIPAHYLHSSGNFHLYDPKARIYFSGDVGASLLPNPGESKLFVDDFDFVIKHAKGFHQRWMGSNRAKTEWLDRISKLKIDYLCPQHGQIYTGEDINRFLNWFKDLKVGITQ